MTEKRPTLTESGQRLVYGPDSHDKTRASKARYRARLSSSRSRLCEEFEMKSAEKTCGVVIVCCIKGATEPPELHAVLGCAGARTVASTHKRKEV